MGDGSVSHDDFKLAFTDVAPVVEGPTQSFGF